MPKRSKSDSEGEFPASYRRLQAQLSKVGWLAMGSVVERNKPGQGGPRYQWSRKVDGKTVTVALSKEQFEWLHAAIAGQREVSKTLEEMHRQALQYMWPHLPDISRRKPLSEKALGVN